MRSLSLPHCHLSQGTSKRKLELLSLSFLSCIVEHKSTWHFLIAKTKTHKSGAFCPSADKELKMSSTTKLNPQILIKQTLCKTKKYCHKSLRNLKSFISVGYQKLSKTPTDKPMSSSGSNKINNTKVQEFDTFYTSFSQQWDSLKKKEGRLSPKVQRKENDEQYCKSSISVADSNGLEDLKQQKKETEYSGRKQNKGSSFRAADALARKMKELDMMDVNDMDHVLDVEEVLHYYSRLTCPTYMEIVDNFFVDMYSEFHVPKPSGSVNSSMRKLGTGSVHSSMRSLGPLKL